MKRMISSSSKPVTAAEENEVLDDAIAELKSNVDYVIEGFEKLGREGKESQILLELSAAVENAVQSIASALTA